MRFRVRLVAMLCAFLLLSGCSGDSAMAQIIRSSKIELNIVADSDLCEFEKQGLRLFVEKLLENSVTPISVSLYYDEDPVLALRNGEADIIYSRSETLEKYHSDFIIYSSPFYFLDYDHVSMTLNSPTFIELTEDDYLDALRANQLAAAFAGSKVFVSQGDPIRTVGDLGNFMVAVDQNPYTFTAIYELSGMAVQYAPESRYEFSDENAITAFEVSTLRIGDFKDSEAGDLYYGESFHRMDIGWLFISEDFQNEISDEVLAAIKEATAYCVEYIDNAANEIYREDLFILQNQGMRSSRFSADTMRREARDRVFKNSNFLERIDKSRYDAVSLIIKI